MASHLSLPHGINKKLKCETKNKLMSVIGPVLYTGPVLSTVNTEHIYVLDHATRSQMFNM